MKSTFEKDCDRIGTNSLKWGIYKSVFNTEDESVIPMWIADMDFEICDVIKNSIVEKLNRGNLGYASLSYYYDEVVKWINKRYNYEIKREWVLYSPGVLNSITFLLKVLAKEGDKILVQSPVYHNFYDVIKLANCEVVENELKLGKDNRYTIDFEDFEKKISQGIKVFLLCNPHNPIGRVWSKDELKNIINICRKYNVYIISDEIHGDLIFNKAMHNTLLSIDESYIDNIFICHASTKAFNIAALYVSNIIIPNDHVRNEVRNMFFANPNIMACEAIKAAYNEGEQWLDDVVEYIEGNYKFLEEYINQNISEIKVTKQEGTFLSWIDCRKLNTNGSGLKEFFVQEARVALSEGKSFGSGGSGFMRMNIGCSRGRLEEALKRIEAAVSKQRTN